MIWETADIERWTGRFRVWMYWSQPYTVPRAQTTRPIIRMVVPLNAPSKNVIVFRSGMWMSASLARTRDGAVAVNAAAPHCRELRSFIGGFSGRVRAGPDASGVGSEHGRCGG